MDGVSGGTHSNTVRYRSVCGGSLYFFFFFGLPFSAALKITSTTNCVYNSNPERAVIISKIRNWERNKNKKIESENIAQKRRTRCAKINKMPNKTNRGERSDFCCNCRHHRRRSNARHICRANCSMLAIHSTFSAINGGGRMHMRRRREI